MEPDLINSDWGFGDYPHRTHDRSLQQTHHETDPRFDARYTYQQYAYSSSPSPSLAGAPSGQYVTSLGLNQMASLGYGATTVGTKGRTPLGQLQPNIPPAPRAPAAPGTLASSDLNECQLIDFLVPAHQQQLPTKPVEPFVLPPRLGEFLSPLIVAPEHLTSRCTTVNIRIVFHHMILDHGGPKQSSIRRPDKKVFSWVDVNLKETSYHQFLNALLEKIGAAGIFLIEEPSTFSFKFWKGGVMTKDAIKQKDAVTVSCEAEYLAFAVAHRQEVVLDINKDDLQVLRSTAEVEKRRQFMADEEENKGGTKVRSLGDWTCYCSDEALWQVPSEIHILGVDEVNLASAKLIEKRWSCDIHKPKIGCYRTGTSECMPISTQMLRAWAIAMDSDEGVDQHRPPNMPIFDRYNSMKKRPKARGKKRDTSRSSSCEADSSPPPDTSLARLRPFLEEFDKVHGKSFTERYYTSLDVEDFAPAILANLHKKEKYGELTKMGMSENNAILLCLFAAKLEEKEMGNGGRGGKQKRRRHH
ncbi:hypothetical protein P7C70_g7263, partial [Phenoliferia sp. Uapishka_3]